MRCKVCGGSLRRTDTYCEYCGEPVPKTMDEFDTSTSELEQSSESDYPSRWNHEPKYRNQRDKNQPRYYINSKPDYRTQRDYPASHDYVPGNSNQQYINHPQLYDNSERGYQRQQSYSTKLSDEDIPIQQNGKAKFWPLISLFVNLILLVAVVFLLVTRAPQSDSKISSEGSSFQAIISGRSESEGEKDEKAEKQTSPRTKKPTEKSTDKPTTKPTSKPTTKKIVTETTEDIISEIISNASSLDIEQLKQNCVDLSYNDAMRNPDDYTGKIVVAGGEVVQVSGSEYRIYDDYIWGGATYKDHCWYIIYKDLDSDKILEGDIVNFYGFYMGRDSYTSVMGAEIPVPIVLAVEHEIVRHK